MRTPRSAASHPPWRQVPGTVRPGTVCEAGLPASSPCAPGTAICPASFTCIVKARHLPDQLPIKLSWEIHVLLEHGPSEKVWLEDYCSQEPNVGKLDRKETNTQWALTKTEKNQPSVDSDSTQPPAHAALRQQEPLHLQRVSKSSGRLTCSFLSHPQGQICWYFDSN